MKARIGILVAVFLGLGLVYALLFTEWIRPAPIEIASQVRASILQPRFGRQPPRRPATNLVTGEIVPGVVRTQVVAVDPARRARLPNWGEIGDAPGGVANVTFSLDDAYVLTRLRVEDVPADGTASKVAWEVAGKSRPTRSLLYGRVPEGMQPVPAGARAEPLAAGVPYRLILEAGRRRGTNRFVTLPAAEQ